MVSVVSGGGAPSLKDQADLQVQAKRQEVSADPLVRRVLDMFPGSQIVGVRSLLDQIPPPLPVVAGDAADDDVGYADAVGPIDDLPDDVDL